MLKTLGRRCINFIQMFYVCRVCLFTTVNFINKDFPVKTKHLYNINAMLDQRRKCWAGVVHYVIQIFCVCWIWLSTTVNFINKDSKNKKNV